MSVSLLLVPAVIAAVAGSTAAGAAGAIGTLASGSAAQSDRSLIVATRMRDLGLLSQAVVDIHGTVAVADDEHLSAIVSDLRLDMTRGADGIWAAHIDAARTVDVDEANALMLALDRAYLARVQQAVDDQFETLFSGTDTVDRLAYQMFTSGSTGDPKGVPISAGNLSAYVSGITDLIR